MTRPKLILHAGRHKTGTTSLQAFLAANDALLLGMHGILYPKSGRAGNFHHPVFRSLIHERTGIDFDIVSRVHDEFEQSGARTLMLSSEMLSRDSVTVEDLKQIQSAFGKFAIDLVIYVRNQSEFVCSTYAEQVKIGILAYPQTINSLFEMLDHSAFIEKFADVFGAGAIRLGVFKESPDFDITQDFFNLIGLANYEKFVKPAGRRNVRYPWSYVELLRYSNTNRILRRIAAHRLTRSLALSLGKAFPRLFDRPLPLTAEDRNFICEKYRQSNRNLAENYLNRRDLFE